MFNELFLHFLKSLWKWIVSCLENNIELCNLYICGWDCVIKCLPAINFWCIELTAGFFLTIYALAKWSRLAFSTFFYYFLLSTSFMSQLLRTEMSFCSWYRCHLQNQKSIYLRFLADQAAGISWTKLNFPFAIW